MPMTTRFSTIAQTGIDDRVPQRFVGANHIEFFRRALIGEPLAHVARDCLGALEDSQTAEEIYKRLARLLVAAARDQHQFSDARLLALRFEPPPDACVRGPVNLAFQGENETAQDPLLSAFRKRFGDLTGQELKKARQTDDLRRKAVAALARIAPRIVVPISPDQELLDWLTSSLTSRLCDAGIFTVGELVAFVNSHEYLFYQQIARLGRKAAGEIRNWLLFNARSGAYTFDLAASAPRRKIDSVLRAERKHASDIVPLEYFVPPTACNGTNGSNRAAPASNLTGANNDREAIYAWLNQRADGTRTKASYRKEAERLMLWATLERHKALSDLTASDITAYVQFIQDPSPAHRWIGSRHVHRWDPTWRPYAGPLSASSACTTTTILQTLFSWLTKHNYLRTNPFSEISKNRIGAPVFQAPYLSHFGWYLLERHARETSGGMRSLAIISLEYWTSLSVSEMVNAKIGDIIDCASPEDSIKWALVIPSRKVHAKFEPIVDDLMRDLIDYMDSRGFGRHPPLWPTNAALIGKLMPETDQIGALSSAALTVAIKTIFAQVADEVFPLYPDAAGWLKKGTPKWMRNVRPAEHKLHPSLLRDFHVQHRVVVVPGDIVVRGYEIKSVLAKTIRPHIAS
jgi:hypothetical protein